MRAFEYCDEGFEMTDPGTWQAVCNALGAEGWQLVDQQILQLEGTERVFAHCYFMREHLRFTRQETQDFIADALGTPLPPEEAPGG